MNPGEGETLSGLDQQLTRRVQRGGCCNPPHARGSDVLPVFERDRGEKYSQYLCLDVVPSRRPAERVTESK